MTFSEESARRIPHLFEAAKKQGSLVSVRDLVPLLPERVTESELVEAFREHPSLGSRFQLKSGYVTERGKVSDAQTLIHNEGISREAAARNLHFVTQFAPLLQSTPFSMVGVSGSTSYLSASRSRDLDLFCIAPEGRMWYSLARALVMARMFNLMKRSAPQICLSCVMDEKYAARAFAEERDPLFARDAISALVLRGQGTYSSLMGKAKWISSIYPTAYSLRTKSPAVPSGLPRASPVLFAIDRFLYIVVGSYIRLKASLLNRRLSKHPNGGSFNVMAGIDHLIYESDRYRSLRRDYASIRSH